jgi:predicted Holliday junction resolvase-like endonuclease
MEIWTIIALVIGIVVGVLIAFALFRASVRWERQAAKEALERERESTRQELEAEFERIRMEWESRIRQEAIGASQAVIRGRVGEQFAPLLPLFKYNPSDARFIGSPIDFVVFDGYASAKDGTLDRPLNIVFVEVKTSKRPRLTKEARLLRDAIQEGNIEYELIKIEVPE